MKNFLKVLISTMVALSISIFMASVTLAEEMIDIPAVAEEEALETVEEQAVFQQEEILQEEVLQEEAPAVEEAVAQEAPLQEEAPVATPEAAPQEIAPEATPEATPEAAPQATEAPAATEMPVESEAPEATEELLEEEIPFAGSVSIRFLDSNPQYGDTVTLQAELSGHENVDYTLCWEYTDDDGENWYAAPGVNNADTYQFTLDSTNANWQWHLVVEVL